jgi:hypothetical protein
MYKHQFAYVLSIEASRHRCVDDAAIADNVGKSPPNTSLVNGLTAGVGRTLAVMVNLLPNPTAS